MFEPTLESVIGIDTRNEIVHLYSMKEGDKNNIDYFVGNYRARPFEKEFYEKLSNILGQYRQNCPHVPMQKVSIILPDSVVMTDTINVPYLNKRAMDSSVAVTLRNLYSNSEDMRYNGQIAMQTRHSATYAMVGIRRDILANVSKVCAENQIGVANITFASNAAVNAAMTLSPRLKNDSFILLDIKEDMARIVFVAKGKTVGFYNLPFGYKILHNSHIMAENTLFDHSAAELLVLNAKEKAKNKALTMAQNTASVSAEKEEDTGFKAVDAPTDDDEDFEEVEVEASEPVVNFITHSTTGFKKSARKLPKFMHRPIPETQEGFVYENFRFFVKWTLEVIASNSALTALGAPEAVYVNMPDEYGFLFEMVNKDYEDNKYMFVPLFTQDAPDNVVRNMELYGGFFAKQVNKGNNFLATAYDTAKAAEADKAEGDTNAPQAAQTKANPLSGILEKLGLKK